MLSYPTKQLFMTTTTTAQLNKLPLTTFIFRIIRFNNHKIQTQTHLVQYVSVVTASNETLTFYFHFEMPNNIYIVTYLFLEHMCTT